MDLPTCAMDPPGCARPGPRLAIHRGDTTCAGDEGARGVGRAGHSDDEGDHAWAEPALDHQELLGDLRAGLDDVAALAIQLPNVTKELHELGDGLPQAAHHASLILRLASRPRVEDPT